MATVTGKSPYEKGYPSTTRYDHTVVTGRNPYEEAFPSTHETGAQPSLDALAKRSSNYSTSTNTGNTRTLTGGSSGSRSTGGTATATASNGLGDAYAALLAAYKPTDYSSFLAEQRAAAQAAYDRGMNTLSNAFNSQLSSLANNLSETRNQLLDQYNRSKKSINDDASSSLKQAYINRMLSEKNLAQQMSARGLSGGATETTHASMLNNYGNARNNINTTTNRNLSNLEGNYSDNLAQAMQAYNSAVANANLQKAQQEIQLENMLANNQISALGNYQSLMASQNDSYLDLLKSAIAHGANFNYTPTQANNAVQAMAYQQMSPLSSDTNYAAWQNFLNNQGTGQNNAAVTTVNPAAQNNYLAAILSQLGR